MIGRGEGGKGGGGEAQLDRSVGADELGEATRNEEQIEGVPDQLLFFRCVWCVTRIHCTTFFRLRFAATKLFQKQQQHYFRELAGPIPPFLISWKKRKGASTFIGGDSAYVR